MEAKPKPRITGRQLWTVAFAVAALVAVALLIGAAGDYGARYTTVALIAGSVGVGELISRYRDEPDKALTTLPALLYILINAGAAAAALAVTLTFDWTFGIDPADEAALVATQLLVAGFGALALFRTSLFRVNVGKQDIGIGPSSLLDIVLLACDRGVDRRRAADRAETVGRIMKQISYDKAKGPLPLVALGLMQNLGPADVAALNLELARLDKDEGQSPRAQALLLGLAISNAVGPHVLSCAIDALREEITESSVETELRQFTELAAASDPPTGNGEPRRSASKRQAAAAH